MNTINNQVMSTNDLLGNFSPLKSMHMKLMNFHYSAIAEKDHYYNEFHICTMKNIKLQNQIMLLKAESKKNSEIITEQAEEIAYMKESLQVQQAELQQCRIKVKMQQDQMSSLEHSLHEQREELQQSEKKIQMQNSQIYALEQTLNDHEGDSERNDQIFQRQEVQIAALQRSIQDRMAQLEQSKQKVEELEEKFQRHMESAENDKCDQKVREETLMENLQACHARLRVMENPHKKKKKAHFWSGFWSERRQAERAADQENESRKTTEIEKADKKEFNMKLKSQEEMKRDETLEMNKTPKSACRVTFNC
ncbi:coiled-coil domain-containing protein 173-like [Syngnathus acus]|uniref:coiled-coil domain-containing protein 173-like n=1 Tax=Syngnathus acus TaxID=161584 RepID=UPI001885DD56|nr:coiled-coil domain-containing protein 173-like [Syngnathus acus]